MPPLLTNSAFKVFTLTSLAKFNFLAPKAAQNSLCLELGHGGEKKELPAQNKHVAQRYWKLFHSGGGGVIRQKTLDGWRGVRVCAAAACDYVM